MSKRWPQWRRKEKKKLRDRFICLAQKVSVGIPLRVKNPTLKKIKIPEKKLYFTKCI